MSLPEISGASSCPSMWWRCSSSWCIKVFGNAINLVSQGRMVNVAAPIIWKKPCASKLLVTGGFLLWRPVRLCRVACKELDWPFATYVSTALAPSLGDCPPKRYHYWLHFLACWEKYTCRHFRANGWDRKEMMTKNLGRPWSEKVKQCNGLVVWRSRDTKTHTSQRNNLLLLLRSRSKPFFVNEIYRRSIASGEADCNKSNKENLFLVKEHVCIYQNHASNSKTTSSFIFCCRTREFNVIADTHLPLAHRTHCQKKRRQQRPFFIRQIVQTRNDKKNREIINDEPKRHC